MKEKTNNKEINFLSGFILKLIGLITMTFDHIGIFLEGYPNLATLALVFRCIGRIAFPIFIFLLVEGVTHTKNFKNYFLRLFSLAAIIIVGQLFVILFIDSSFSFPSPINDLVVTSLMVFLLNKRNKLSFLAVLPIAYSILCFVISNYEYANYTIIKYLPSVIRTNYDFYGIILGLGYYLAKRLTERFFNSSELLKNISSTSLFQVGQNIICVLIVFLGTFAYCLIKRLSGVEFPNQSFAVVAALPIAFYSGKRGYNKKWFQYGSYLYFPLHLVIIYLAFIIFG